MRIGSKLILAGAAATALCYLILLYFGIPVAVSAGLGLCFGMGMTLVMSSRMPGARDLSQDAMDRKDQALRTNREIMQQSALIEDRPTREALQEACGIFPRMLDKAPPGELASTAARLQVQLTNLSAAVKTYLAIQPEPELYSDGKATGEEMLIAAQRRLRGVRTTAVKGMQQLNRGDVTAFQVSLNALAPPNELPEIT